MIQDDSRSSQLLKGVLDLCLLAVIAEEPAYGYEMTKLLSQRGLEAVAQGSIYPVLGRLEREKLVESFNQPSNGGPPRKYYRATPRGSSMLGAWASDWEATRTAVDRVLSDRKEGS